MVARGVGAVGCAHCKTIGADRACQICTRHVCPRCAADWTTCDEPSGRVIRLGLTARVRDVDPLGRLALVSHWRRPLRLFDLRRLRWSDVELPRTYWLFARQFPPRLTGDGRLFYPEFSAVGTGDRSPAVTAMRVHVLRTGASERVTREPPYGSTGVSATRDRYWYVTDSQQVAIVRGAPQVPTSASMSLALVEPLPREVVRVDLVEPLPRKVIHAAHVDGERDLLAAGSWSELVLHRIGDGKLERISYTKTLAVGDVRWIAVAGSWLVAAIAGGAGTAHVEVYRLGRDLSIGAVEHTHAGVLVPGAASLSRDGRYLALGFDRGLVVHELGTDSVATFDEHTDRINYVRFADDHVLVSADTDNRVVMRPRTPTGYARPLVTLEVPDERVALPSFEPPVR